MLSVKFQVLSFKHFGFPPSALLKTQPGKAGTKLTVVRKDR